MAKKNWISEATKNKGALHKALGVSEKKKLTQKQLARGKAMGGAVAKAVNLANTLNKIRKKHGVK
jgi:hypothetical protein